MTKPVQPSLFRRFIAVMRNARIGTKNISATIDSDTITPNRCTVSDPEQTPDRFGPIQAPLVKDLAHSITPDEDLALVRQEFKYHDKDGAGYWTLAEYDTQTISLLANALRIGVPAPTLKSIPGSSKFETDTINDPRVASRRTAEYVAILLTVRDVLFEDRYRHLQGRNDASYADAFSELFMVLPGTPNYFSDPLPMNTDGDINGYSALIRYMLSVKYPLGVRTIQYSEDEYPEARRVFNPEWISLICRLNKPEDTAALVAYYDERGADPAGAIKYLDEHDVTPLGSGWL